MSTEGVVHHSVHFLRNPANLITSARIAASPVLFAAILNAEDQNGASWLAFILCWLFGFTDWLDGHLARNHGWVSRSGAFLDPLADKVVVIGSFISLWFIDRFWWLPVVLVTAREVGITFFRSYWVRKGLAVPARTLGKYKSFFQGLAIVAAVFPPWKNQTLVADLLLWLAVAFTMYSGLLYLLDGSAATRTRDELKEK